MGKRSSVGQRKPIDQPTRGGDWQTTVPYALLSLGSFVAALLLIGLLLGNASLLVSLGLEGRFYYLALLPLGLAVTGFLFGALRSFALYRGRHGGGALELGGPIVGFALVVIGGFFLPPPATNFPLTVYVHGPAGPQDLPLRNQGEVLLDLGGDRRRQPIGDAGQALFLEIPPTFRGQKINVALLAPNHERANRGPLALKEQSLYLSVRRKAFPIAGETVDESGRPIARARVNVAGISATSDGDGRFSLVVRSEQAQDELVLRVDAEGYEAWSQTVMPNGGPVAVVLHR
jgi:hypothetical protein